MGVSQADVMQTEADSLILDSALLLTGWTWLILTCLNMRQFDAVVALNCDPIMTLLRLIIAYCTVSGSATSYILGNYREFLTVAIVHSWQMPTDKHRNALTLLGGRNSA